LKLFINDFSQQIIGEKTSSNKKNVTEELERQYPYLSNQFEVKRIGLFGSAADGTQSDKSDIDLIVEFDRSIGLKFIELVEYLEKIFKKRIDVITQGGLKNIRIKKVSNHIKKNIIYVKTI